MRIGSALIFLLFIFGCSSRKETALQLFSSLPANETGVEFSNDLSDDQFNLIDYMYFYNGAGVAIGDVNNDGLKDIFFTSNQNSNTLYLNKGGWKFEDITQSAGLEGQLGWTTGVTMADVNGDGFLDIYVCQLGNYLNFNGKNQLYINNGDLTFSDIAGEVGVDFSGYSTQALFFDYDNDNDLDLYLLNHALHTDHAYREAKYRTSVDSLAGDRLFQNDGDGNALVFTDVTTKAGIYSSQLGYGLGVAAGDVNFDGQIDLYISNDFHENDYLYLNQGDGTFRESLESSLGHSSRYSMGNDMADINNDGLLDIMTLDMLPKEEEILKKSVGEDSYEVYEIKLEKGYHHQLVRNNLQLNRGQERFSDIALMTDIYATDWSWSPLIADFDNDGIKDIYITNGIYKRPNDLDYVNYHSNNSQQLYQRYSQDSVDRFLLDMMPTLKISNFAYSGRETLSFGDSTAEWGLDIPSYSNGAAYGDLDNDGDLDLVVNNIEDKAFILRNNTDSLKQHTYLKVIIKGPKMNSKGLGTKVLLYSKGQIQYQEVMATRGFISSVDTDLIFGLGPENRADSLIVIWPDGKAQTLTELKAVQLELNYADADEKFQYPDQKPLNPVFTPMDSGIPFRHRENTYVDYNQEYLIPHKISVEGPKMATGDLNGDGLDDLVFGGASGQPCQIFLQQMDGSFSSNISKDIQNQFLQEDVGIGLFDMDGDSDLDLYLVRGGNEKHFRDGLFENDGKGNFKAFELSPEIESNGSCVKPYDYDNDGDIDLFVGSRNIPGNYGVNPGSWLLENDGTGKFTDATDHRAPELNTLGMVTGAVWGDFNGDKYPDLAVVGEWMPLTFLYGGENGEFTHRTIEFSEGWWNTLESFDYDHDGDLDLVAGNLGLNSKIKASKEEPATLYIKDFDNDGKDDQILCFYKEGKSVPFASRDELIKQMAGLKKKFVSYQDYGNVGSIEGLFSAEELKNADVKKAYVLESSVFENLGDGNFRLKKLPQKAQFSPIQAILCSDFNGDGNIDLLTAGNFSGAVINRGMYDADYGLMLEGDGTGNFTPMGLNESGLVLDGVVRDMKILDTAIGKILVIARNDQEVQVFKINL